MLLARPATKKTKKASESERVAEQQPGVQPAALEVAEPDEVERAGRHDADDDREAQRDLVADHLAGLAHRPVNGPLVIAGPPRQDDADHLDAQDGQHPEEADVEPRLEVEFRPERQCQEGGEDRRERQVRREAEQKRVGAGGDQVFLQQQFAAVGDGLEQADRADAVGPEPALDVPGHLPLPPDAEHRDGRGEADEDGGDEDDVVNDRAGRREREVQLLEDQPLHQRRGAGGASVALSAKTRVTVNMGAAVDGGTWNWGARKDGGPILYRPAFFGKTPKIAKRGRLYRRGYGVSRKPKGQRTGNRKYNSKEDLNAIQEPDYPGLRRKAGLLTKWLSSSASSRLKHIRRQHDLMATIREDLLEAGREKAKSAERESVQGGLKSGMATSA